jgi:hypothetical protein
MVYKQPVDGMGATHDHWVELFGPKVATEGHTQVQLIGDLGEVSLYCAVHHCQLKFFWSVVRFVRLEYSFFGWSAVSINEASREAGTQQKQHLRCYVHDIVVSLGHLNPLMPSSCLGQDTLSKQRPGPLSREVVFGFWVRKQRLRKQGVPHFIKNPL